MKDGDFLAIISLKETALKTSLKNAYLERGKIYKNGYASRYRNEDYELYFKLNFHIQLK